MFSIRSLSNSLVFFIVTASSCSGSERYCLEESTSRRLSSSECLPASSRNSSSVRSRSSFSSSEGAAILRLLVGGPWGSCPWAAPYHKACGVSSGRLGENQPERAESRDRPPAGVPVPVDAQQIDERHARVVQFPQVHLARPGIGERRRLDVQHRG